MTKTHVKKDQNWYLFHHWRLKSINPMVLLLFVFFVFVVQQVAAVTECMGAGNSLKCFDCNSFDNEYCGDPFNWTTLPPVKPCDGCCVKMVQGIGTADVKIRRGCTDDIEINMFMVDHVCMTEGGGKGKMCFCESNECNGVQTDRHAMQASSPSSPPAKVIRTCTTELRINLFIVDHVCMSQSNRKGTLCFCEEDLCNTAYNGNKDTVISFIVAAIVSYMHAG